ncbi:hypothetical protein BKA81DRAFT_378775 [Phyllosticta paracitricarpa]
MCRCRLSSYQDAQLNHVQYAYPRVVFAWFRRLRKWTCRLLKLGFGSRINTSVVQSMGSQAALQQYVHVMNDLIRAWLERAVTSRQHRTLWDDQTAPHLSQAHRLRQSRHTGQTRSACFASVCEYFYYRAEEPTPEFKSADGTHIEQKKDPRIDLPLADPSNPKKKDLSQVTQVDKKRDERYDQTTKIYAQSPGEPARCNTRAGLLRRST